MSGARRRARRGRRGWAAAVAAAGLALLADLLGSVPAGAAGPVRLDPAAGRIALGRYLDLLEDPGGRWTIEDVTSGPASSLFRPSKRASPSFGFTRSAYWARFRVTAQGSAGERLLEVCYRGLDHISVFVPAGEGGHVERRGGDLLPFRNREIPHRHEVYRIQVPPDGEASYYVRVASDGPVVLPLILWAPEAFARHDHDEQLLFGAFYGVFLVVILSSLFFFLAMRDEGYLFFTLFIAGYSLAQVIENGLALEYLWPDSPRWDNVAFPMAVGLAAFWAVEFARYFLSIRAHAPRLDRTGKALTVLAVVIVAGSALVPYRLAMQAATLLSLAVILTIFAMTGVGLRRRDPFAWYFFVGCSAPLAGGAVTALANFGILPHGFLTYHGSQVGASVLVVVLSMGQAVRIHTLQRAKERAEAESIIDGLTRVANRRRLDAYLDVEWKRAQREHRPLSLVMADLDFFHHYNETLGHLLGDECLRSIAGALQRTLNRPGDLIARYGGEEFAVVLPGTDARGAQHVAERLLQAIRELKIPHPGSAVAEEVTATLGLGTIVPEPGSSPAELIRRADGAMLRGKREGRNRVRPSWAAPQAGPGTGPDPGKGPTAGGPAGVPPQGEVGWETPLPLDLDRRS